MSPTETTMAAESSTTPKQALPGRTADGQRKSYRVVRDEQHAIVRQELLDRFGENGRIDPNEDPVKWRRAIRTNPMTGTIYRVLVAVVGLALIVAGVPLVPLVGPGWAIIFVGLFLWSTEFMWARRVTQFVKAEVKAFEQYTRGLPWRAKVPLLCVSAIFGWLCFWLVLVLIGVPTWLPDQVEDLLLWVPGLSNEALIPW